MTTINLARWQLLKRQDPERGMFVEPVDPAIQSCSIGVDDEGQLHLLVQISEEPEHVPQELQAVTVRVVELDGLYLDIFAAWHYEMIFTPIANRIFTGIAIQGRSPAEVVKETIEEFRGALKPITPELSLAEQIGLFGELWVLRNALLPCVGNRSCELWSGPNYERHDFVGNALHIEVKKTTRSEDRHEISRIDQLKAPEGKSLLFASIQVERTEGGSQSLATLIDEIMEQLGTDGRAIATFEEKLSKAKWNDSLRQSSSLKRFNLRAVHFFEVSGTFPRLPDNYVPPRGIVAIRYTIDISSLSVVSRASVEEYLQLL